MYSSPIWVLHEDNSWNRWVLKAFGERHSTQTYHSINQGSILLRWWSSEARLNISARGMRTTGKRSFFDTRVFNPFARRYSGLTLSQAYRTNENEKKRLYNDRGMSVEHGTFIPLVFCSSGGIAPECNLFFQKPVFHDCRPSKGNLFSCVIMGKDQTFLCPTPLGCALY